MGQLVFWGLIAAGAAAAAAVLLTATGLGRQLNAWRLLHRALNADSLAMTVSVQSGETFTAKGRVVRVEGWRILFEKDRRAAEEKRRKNPKAAGGRDPDGEDEDDAQTLPALKKGDICDVRAVKGREDKTKPPQFFTEGTLIAAMENIWRSFDDPKGQAMLKEASGIGTPATRAAIIAELRRKEYLETEGK